MPRFETRWNRREVLRAGVLSAWGLTLTDFLRARTSSRGSALAADGSARRPAAAKSKSAKANAAILIWLDGGPSHLDTLDLKPDAPREVRGPFQPIATEVGGIDICEYLPATARVMRHVALLRSMTSNLGEHNLGSQYLLTGYRPSAVLQYPSYGSVLAHLANEERELPPYVAIPEASSHAAQGFLDARAAPFHVGGDPARPDFKVRDLEAFPGLTPERLARRREFSQALAELERDVESSRQPPIDEEFAQAYRLLTSARARQAFDLSQEPQELRARYGDRTVGQSCLLARRLVEAGVPFVTVTDSGWDTHDQLFNRLKEGFTGGTVGKIPALDLAYAALLADLEDRGLLETTLVILMGEFGRTPKLNVAGGRDHWPRVFSVALAGGGILGAQVIGQSDSRGESPSENPIRPEDLACTIYTLLGISPDRELTTPEGRPVRVNSGGSPIQGLIA